MNKSKPLTWQTVAKVFTIVTIVGFMVAALPGCTDNETRIDQIKQEAIASMQAKADEVEAEKARVAAEVRRAQRDGENRLKALGNDADAEAARIKAEVEDKADGAQLALAAFAAKRADDIGAIKRSADASIAKIQAQQVGLEQLGQLAQSPVVSGLLSAIPGGGLVPLAITAALGYGVRSRSAKQSDASWDEATKHYMALMATPPSAGKGGQ